MAPFIVALAEDVAHRTVLDIGPGWGKYERLLREYLNIKPERIDAVEAWYPYIGAHGLEHRYDTVFHGRASDPVWHGPAGEAFDAAQLLAGYDLVLMVDVIEHMPRDEAIELLGRIPGRVVICTPVDYFSNGPGLPPTEEHVSHWVRADWDDLGHSRPVEACSDVLGGWLVRLGPLPAAAIHGAAA